MHLLLVWLQVALHDAHVLTTLDLYNGGNESVKVELVTSPGLDRSVTFQLENENLEITDIADANQLYNIIGLVRSHTQCMCARERQVPRT